MIFFCNAGIEIGIGTEDQGGALLAFSTPDHSCEGRDDLSDGEGDLAECPGGRRRLTSISSQGVARTWSHCPQGGVDGL